MIFRRTPIGFSRQWMRPLWLSMPGKGIEAQTLKLFEVCRRRGVPIFVFINKMDRPSRPPLELIDELETVLKLAPAPVNWPLGEGPRFRGVYDRRKDEVNLFERTSHGSFKAPLEVAGIGDDMVREALSDELHLAVTSEIELLDGLTETIDVERGSGRPADANLLRKCYE